MGWSSDPELQELFRNELIERVDRLVEGSRAMQHGETTDEIAGAMLREGHTIKGTGRVMGFEAISRAGQMLEQTWRRIQHGDLTAHPDLGRALERLSAVLPDATTADPVEGTPELSDAIAELTKVLSDDPEDAAASGPAGEAAAVDTDRRDAIDAASDLGGLLGALESWASEESILVNAGKLFRLLNQLGTLRIDIEAIADRARQTIGSAELDADESSRIADAIEASHRAAVGLEKEALSLAAVPMKEFTNTLPQLVRYLAKKTGKQIAFDIVGDDLAVDRQVVERLADPIRQLVVNAVAHGVEPPAQREAAGKPATARIALRATVKESQLHLSIDDDGHGVDWAAVRRRAHERGLVSAEQEPDGDTLRALLFVPGFSTVETAGELVGDGSGLARVAEAVEALYGSLAIETVPDRGTTVTVTVPTSRALQRAVLVAAGDQIWGIPEAAVQDILPTDAVEVSEGPDGTRMIWRDRVVPVATFSDVVGLGAAQGPATRVVVIRGRIGAAALLVERVVAQREVAAKELGPLLAGPSHLTGAALLGGDEVALLVDAARLAERARNSSEPTAPTHRVLVVDDSQGARQVVAGALASSGFATSVAASVYDALRKLEAEGADALVVDFAMPQADGIALVQQVRARYGSLPIVMLSGVATPDDQRRARDAGVDVFYDKADFREGALAESLHALLASRVETSEAVSP